MVGLVSDFFLQMFFFTTILSIDIRRMEVRAESSVCSSMFAFSLPPPHALEATDGLHRSSCGSFIAAVHLGSLCFVKLNVSAFLLFEMITLLLSAPPSALSLSLLYSTPRTAGRSEPTSPGRSRHAPFQTWPLATPRDAPATAAIPPHHHTPGAGVPEPSAAQEAAGGVLPGSHAPGSAHHHGERCSRDQRLGGTADPQCKQRTSK